MMDIDFRSTSDDNVEPWSTDGGVCQRPQDVWTALSVATLVKCVNDEDESMFGGARKVADELKEESALHRPRRQVWVFTKTFCDNAPKRGEDHCKFVDEGRQDISGLIQNQVFPPAEKSASKVISLVKGGTNRIS